MKKQNTFRKQYNFEFESQKNKKAYNSWIKAISLLGGPAEASRSTGIKITTISNINMGRYGKQLFPTPEQAIKISTSLNREITPEDLKPNHDFSYIYEHFDVFNKINNK